MGVVKVRVGSIEWKEKEKQKINAINVRICGVLAKENGRRRGRMSV